MKQFIGEKLKTNKIFGFCLIIIATFGLSCTLFQIFGYDTFIRPYLFTLTTLPPDIYAKVIADYPQATYMYDAFTTNNVSGLNQLAYFTCISNVLTNLYILSLGLSIVGVKKVQKIGFNRYYAGSVTMFIAITGIIYSFIMLPFISKEKTGWVYLIPGCAMFDFLGYWQHMVLPIIMLILWYLPFSNERLEKKKFNHTAWTFPVLYSIFTLVRGFCGARYQINFAGDTQTWFPYPFLAADRFEPYVASMVGGEPTEAVLYTFTALAYIACIVIMFITPTLIRKIDDKYLTRLEKSNEFLDNKNIK